MRRRQQNRIFPSSSLSIFFIGLFIYFIQLNSSSAQDNFQVELVAAPIKSFNLTIDTENRALFLKYLAEFSEANNFDFNNYNTTLDGLHSMAELVRFDIRFKVSNPFEAHKYRIYFYDNVLVPIQGDDLDALITNLDDYLAKVQGSHMTLRE